MRKLSLVIGLALVFMSAVLVSPPPSPHGDQLKVSCDKCHSTKGWKLDKEIYSFDHNSTALPLTGQHLQLDCRSCHPTLVFNDAGTECANCHTDMHNQTVGPDCQRCHTTRSWIVENTTELHQRSRFPLVGPHYTADCGSCHPSASLLRFEPLGVTCFDCHKEDYTNAAEPNHVAGNYPTTCEICHSISSFTWNAGNIDHSFFPLSGGHAITCNRCHTNGGYSGLSRECITCHQTDYNNTTNPNHSNLQFSTNCSECHTTNPGWKPAQYSAHDAIFPIYSGKHNGTWNSCTQCHPNASNYSLFSCIDCHDHNQSDMDKEHEGVNGYAYNSPACLACHPTGSAEGGFNHNATAFPLTGAHITQPCADCHTAGYTGTPTQCSACHTNAYNETSNPSHVTLGIATTCEQCHTTNPGWKPALFPTHNNYYVLEGAHISQACESCHKGNYNTTPNTCFGCHEPEYNQTTNPPHLSSQFSTGCGDCHTQNSWVPSTFDHDGTYFPIYSGKHKGEWNQCTECHTTPANYTVFSCIDCHEHSNQAQVNNDHQGVQGYIYNSQACYDCHPRGEADGKLIRSIIQQKQN